MANLLTNACASTDVYAIQYSLPAAQSFHGIPPKVRGEVLKRLREIAEVAGYFSAPSHGVNTELRLETAGFIVTYVLSPACHALTVLGVVPCSEAAVVGRFEVRV